MDKEGEEVPVLIAQTGPLNGQRWSLNESILIGRETTCDIAILDRQVSRHHARLTPTPNGIYLEDLGSKNGTHYNGEPLRDRTMLQDGDVIQIALAQQFVFLASDATLPLDAEEIELQSFQSGQMSAVSQPHAGRLRLEKRSRRVWIGEKEVLPPLSASQFHLLELLYEHQGKVVSRQKLIADVWEGEQAVEVSEQALDALVRRLRDRLASIDPTHAYITTVRGHGLRLENPL
ncbi:MAG TPA: FHA domain-containing protein [Anaerolineales bacterium]